MLSNRTVRPTLPALDIGRARRFYAETLGLKVALENPGGVVFECASGASKPGWAASATFLVYPSPNPERAGHTQMGWEVDDIEATVAELKAREVEFLEYDTPHLRTENSIAPIMGGAGKAAWFKDTEGNLLGLVKLPGGP